MATGGQGSWLSRNVIVLGVVSLLTDTASEMVMPLLPVFLLGLAGAGAPLALGVIEGLADAVASVLKLYAGRWADKLGRNRPFVLAGYAIASAARPFVALATAPWHVLVVRCTDRVGKGLRTSPRDALIAATVAPQQRGAAFSLHRAMDHTGAILGPLIAAALLAWFTQDLRLLFWLTAIPGALVVLVAWVGVREVPKPEEPPAPVVRANKPLVAFLVPLGVFTLGNASEVFLLLKVAGEDLHESLTTFPLLWVALHIVKAATSVPGGKLSDKLGRVPMIAAGWLLYSGVFAALAFAQDRVTVYALLATYGVYVGLTEGAQRALIAEVAPRKGQGAAFGWYYLTMGLLALVASVMFGALWHWFSPATAFLTSAGLAIVAVALLLAARTRHQLS
jgi:MFS family permease